MKMGKKIRTWELRQRYRVIAEDAEKKPNRKRNPRRRQRKKRRFNPQ